MSAAITGDYRSLAEAAGEVTMHHGWTPGVDFDPSDPDDMDLMELVWEREAADSATALRRENAALRAEVARLRADASGMDPDDIDDEPGFADPAWDL